MLHVHAAGLSSGPPGSAQAKPQEATGRSWMGSCWHLVTRRRALGLGPAGPSRVPGPDKGRLSLRLEPGEKQELFTVGFCSLMFKKSMAS